MAIRKMSLSWIVSSDISKTKSFFVETLGLQVTNSAEEYGWLEVQGEEGGMILGIGQESKEKENETEKPGSNAVVTMTVDDIVKEKAELEAKGVHFIDEILEVPGHVKMVTFVDPDGNKFQLVQELDLV